MLALISLAAALLLTLWIARYVLFLALIVKGALGYKTSVRRNSKAPRFTLLVPAHNEELGIAATVGSLQALDYPRENFRILVIADNCSDQTAAVARACGADVLERFDDTKKSKGFALEYAIHRLRRDGDQIPDALVVIDADTRADPGLLQAFANRLVEGQEWMQAYYSVSNPDDSWRTRLMTIAFALFNGVWLAGQDKLGIGAALRGNGMAFAWRALERYPWKAYGLAEDLEFSWHLRLAGERVHFVPEAKVYGEIISDNAAASQSQRLRWEHGRRELRTIFGKELRAKTLPPFTRFLMDTDLTMPALSRLVAVTVLAFALGLVSLLSSPGPTVQASASLLVAINALALGLLFIYVSLAFLRFHLPIAYLRSLGKLPVYMVWKFFLIFQKTPKAWVRTQRKSEGATPE